ncbi:GntR family transcriptional regulator [Pseudoroseomonas globiformis]|uniref:GntR family transcriptional regulator n=1 Tax=Teichococcus globiformis TaxID=2307229 RepID=A0ABV7FTK0_9PROT
MASLQALEGFTRLNLAGPVGLNIAHFLRDAIIRNQLCPGQSLPEAEVSQVMGVSRQPVRDALIRLSEAGLLRILPQRGTLVTRISVSGVRSGHFVRQAVECAVIRRAATEAGDAAIARIGRMVDAQEEALAAADHGRFFMLDNEMHEAFAAAIGLHDAWTALSAVKLQMDRVRYLSLPETTPGPLLIRQHRAILAALVARHADAAEAAMIDHLSEVHASLPQLVGRFPDHFDKGD